MQCGVLIVDDHAEFRTRLRALLTVAGYEVVGEACDGASGVEAVGELGPELVLLDIQLPDLTGFEVADALSRASHPPVVVFVSSRDESDYGSRIRRSGAQGFISKGDLSAGSLNALLRGTGR